MDKYSGPVLCSRNDHQSFHSFCGQRLRHADTGCRPNYYTNGFGHRIKPTLFPDQIDPALSLSNRAATGRIRRVTLPFRFAKRCEGTSAIGCSPWLVRRPNRTSESHFSQATRFSPGGESERRIADIAVECFRMSPKLRDAFSISYVTHRAHFFLSQRTSG